jgi:hypothetical protein
LKKNQSVTTNKASSTKTTEPTTTTTSITHVGTRIFQEAKQNPQVSGRSQDVVTLQRECERLLKHLHELIDIGKQYKTTMVQLESNRTLVSRSGTEMIMTKKGGKHYALSLTKHCSSLFFHS